MIQEQEDIFDLIKRGGRKARVCLMIKTGTNPNEFDANGIPLLTHACTYDQTEICKQLIYAGAIINAGDGAQSPLHAAAEKGAFECVNVLLAANADIRVRNNEGSIPLQTAIKKSCETDFYDNKDKFNKVSQSLQQFDETGQEFQATKGFCC